MIISMEIKTEHLKQNRKKLFLELIEKQSDHINETSKKCNYKYLKTFKESKEGRNNSIL